jgi:hypothetical protein
MCALIQSQSTSETKNEARKQRDNVILFSTTLGRLAKSAAIVVQSTMAMVAVYVVGRVSFVQSPNKYTLMV